MEKKIKIFLIHTRNIFEQDGASANRWRTMVEGLIKEGVQIKIIFTQGYGSVNEFKKYGWTGKIGNISYSYSSFLLHSSLLMRRISVYLLAPLFKRINSLYVAKQVTKFEPNIIWLQPVIEVFDIYLSANIHRKRFNYKLMIELNEFNDIGNLHSTNKLQLYKSERYSRILLTKILPNVDLSLIMTRQLLEHFKQFTDPVRAAFLHLPMTVDLKRFDLKRNSCGRYIAYCGSSSFVKDGVDILIKSFAQISEKYPDVRLKIAAFMEADGGKMLALIHELQLQNKIEYVGELHRGEIPEFITNAEILALPRPDSRQAQGGFPTKLGEYLATGNPVCATNVGEIFSYLTDNESAFMAVPGSVDSFVSILSRALSDRKNAKRVGLNGRKVAEENFSMELQAKRLYDFLNEQVGN
ncbi:MAG TPA: glycosyltransferase family 4 protein [Paludibacter sp.]